MTAGELREKVAFERRAPANDGAGNLEDAWTSIGQPVAASITFVKGGETVVGQRLQGNRPAVIKVRWSRAAATVGADCRIRDVRSGLTFNVSAPTPDTHRRYIDFLCVAGGADG